MLERKTNSDTLTAFALLAFFVGLVIPGFMLTPAQAQSDLFKLETMKPAYDDRFQSDVQQILDSYHWTRPFVIGNFSCSDVSIYTMMLFENHGYTAVCVTDEGPDNESLSGTPQGHMWVAVDDPRHKEAWIFVEGAGGFYPNKEPMPHSIGTIMYGDQYQIGYVTTDPLGYIMKHDSSRQTWRQHYSLSDTNAPQPN
jgi:hypothetical protein